MTTITKVQLMIPDCIHAPGGLCPDCQADYEEDPEAWLEFGEHQAGIERWRKLQEEMDADAAAQRLMAAEGAPDKHIPF